jgi:allophanate hydrolase subunit 2
MAARGLRLYLAAEGGWACNALLGSCAVSVREGLGRPLEAGDLLRAHPPRPLPLEGFVPERYRHRFDPTITLRILESYHHDRFSVEARERFYAQRFRVTTATDRMGCRLGGEPIAYPGEIVSEPTTSGAVQIPADGQPIVLMAEHQTIGGYPIIGTVLPCDLDRLAQAQPGTEVLFRPVSTEEAVQSSLRSLRLPPVCL